MAPELQLRHLLPHRKPRRQEQGAKGYECQICGDSYAKDPKKTGSLYDIEDVKQSAAKTTSGRRTSSASREAHRAQVNGRTTVDYTEPDPPNRKKGREGRVCRRGLCAPVRHDPVSKVAFRNIRVKVLPDCSGGLCNCPLPGTRYSGGG
jgi:hypothetical protein